MKEKLCFLMLFINVKKDRNMKLRNILKELTTKSGPLGDFEYYFNNASEKLNRPGVKIKEIRDEEIKGRPCIIILYEELRNPYQEFVKIFYNTDDERKIILNAFKK